MSSVLNLPARWRGTPSGQAVVEKISALKRRNAELSETRKTAMAPAALTMYTQGGALAAAAASVYLPEDRVQAAQWIGGLGCIVMGATWGRQDMVAAGNGILAIATYNAARERLFKRSSFVSSPSSDD